MTESLPFIWAIVPAAGIGSRMQADRPKQYLPLCDQTLLEVTLKKLLSVPEVNAIVLALNENDQYWPHTSLYRHPKIHRIVGGSERSDSVRLGLEYCMTHSSAQQSTDASWALVHDAARPCVSQDNISRLIATAIDKRKKQGFTGAILAAPCTDTIKRVVSEHEHIECTEDRAQLWLAHTPQFFPVHELHHALNEAQAKGVSITDEASAIESIEGKVAIVCDRRDNIKVTVSEDLLWAETILQQQGFTSCE